MHNVAIIQNGRIAGVVARKSNGSALFSFVEAHALVGVLKARRLDVMVIAPKEGLPKVLADIK